MKLVQIIEPMDLIMTQVIDTLSAHLASSFQDRAILQLSHRRQCDVI